MILLEVIFRPFIPSTLLGLLGLISGYLFFYFKNKNNNKLKEIQSASPKDRIKAIEMFLNELGVSINTDSLEPAQKFLLIKGLMKAKTNRYLILSITAIVLSSFITFLIWNDSNRNNNNVNSNGNDSNANIKLTTTNDISTLRPLNDTIKIIPPGGISHKGITDTSQSNEIRHPFFMDPSGLTLSILPTVKGFYEVHSNYIDLYIDSIIFFNQGSGEPVVMSIVFELVKTQPTGRDSAEKSTQSRKLYIEEPILPGKTITVTNVKSRIFTDGVSGLFRYYLSNEVELRVVEDGAETIEYALSDDMAPIKVN